MKLTNQTAPSFCGKKNDKPKDIYKDTPIRYLSCTNEIGEAVSSLCATSSNRLVKAIPVLGYVPAVGYTIADVFDKYKKGEDGTGEKPSLKMGARELIWQGITNIVAPTAIIRCTQKLTKQATEKRLAKIPEFMKAGANNAKNSGIAKLLGNTKAGKSLKNMGKSGKVLSAGFSLMVLVAAMKPVDFITEKVLLKGIVDPLLGLNKKED